MAFRPEAPQPLRQVLGDRSLPVPWRLLPWDVLHSSRPQREHGMACPAILPAFIQSQAAVCPSARVISVVWRRNGANVSFHTGSAGVSLHATWAIVRYATTACVDYLPGVVNYYFLVDICLDRCTATAPRLSSYL